MLFYNIVYQDIVTINLWCQHIVSHHIKPTEGIRDFDLLQSIPKSINQSFSKVELYPTIYDKCTQLWYCLSQYHCFTDGNKRTALVTVIVYLSLHGYNFIEKTIDLYEICVNIASGNIDKTQIKLYLLKNTFKDYDITESKIKTPFGILDILSTKPDFIVLLEKLSN